MIENVKSTTLGWLDSVSRSGETRGRFCEEHLRVLQAAADLTAPTTTSDLFHTYYVMIDMIDDTMDEAVEDGSQASRRSTAKDGYIDGSML